MSVFYKLIASIQLDKDITYLNLNEYLSKRLNHVFLYDSALSKMHLSSQIKGYVFSSLAPLEKDKLYKKNKFYQFTIYCSLLSQALKLKDAITKETSITLLDVQAVQFRQIKSLHSITPCLITIPDNSQRGYHYWTHNDSNIILISQIEQNSFRKAKQFFDSDNTVTSRHFIKSLKVRNRKDIVLDYKQTKLIASSLDIQINQDEDSQFLANVCLATGVGEKNALGLGFCIAQGACV